MSEIDMEALTAGGRRLSDFALDEQIAVADARMRVAAAHGYGSAADAWRSVVLAFYAVRSERAAMGRAVDELFTGLDDDVGGICDNG